MNQPVPPFANPKEEGEGSNNTLNKFAAGLKINPHYAKRYKGGEDAACLTPRMLAVADGVGGWAESGVDPAIYSKRLC